MKRIKERPEYLQSLPVWKKILYYILSPVLIGWLALTWAIMQLGKGTYRFGDFLSGNRWNRGDWSEDV